MFENQSTYRTPASCGELLQGVIEDSFALISCPVNLYNTVTIQIDTSGVIKCDSELQKSITATERTLAFFEKSNLGATVKVSNPIPKLKGLGSSTSDITSCIAATADAIGEPIEALQIASIATSIEPSDATMFEEMVLFGHRTGLLIDRLGDLPLLDILAIDFGGTVDTVEYNMVDRFSVWKQHEKETQNALIDIAEGIKTNNVALIGKGATANTFTAQKIKHNPDLDQVIELAQSINAAGISLAHSGTIISIILDPNQKQMTYALKQAKSKLRNWESINHFKTTRPGPIQIT
ncbi:MAG: hypothetical protein FI694_02035 [SAR202 cluster bacterium]|nr:hypothetical protein [SAR202 cluster bacterium]MQG52374.1 hypothetical protein [SAR202 cluster bacterium]|tara:strand:- start:455 stop:1333 length:879 start_codon:yes stop_codon:yes gene_type:complete